MMISEDDLYELREEDRKEAMGGFDEENIDDEDYEGIVEVLKEK